MISKLLVTLALAGTPKAGDVAPDFTVKDVEGNVIELRSLVEKHIVILAFFPKAFTPG